MEGKMQDKELRKLLKEVGVIEESAGNYVFVSFPMEKLPVRLRQLDDSIGELREKLDEMVMLIDICQEYNNHLEAIIEHLGVSFEKVTEVGTRLRVVKK
jgi:ethanolamine utilization protein EutA (predicted chaperonin)